MSTRTIPAQIVMTCDCCGVEIQNHNHRMAGHLILKAHALDVSGHAVADATRKLDLCDPCLYKVGKAIDGVITTG